MGRCATLAWTVLLALAPHPARAWGPDGHRIIGEIAWHELTPAAKRAVRELLPRGRYGSLAEASVWADVEARGNPRYAWLDPYHYVDTDPHAPHVDAASDCACVLAGIERFGREIADPTQPHRERVMALRLFAHFVGDVHQPLHVTGADGHGGTRTFVFFLDQRETLHQVWDTGLIAHQLGGRGYRSYAKALADSITDAQRAKWTAQLDPRVWADESLALARRHLLRTRGGAQLGPDYFEREMPIVAQRLRQAGVRLGAWLNRRFGAVVTQNPSSGEDTSCLFQRTDRRMPAKTPQLIPLEKPNLFRCGPL
jgi:hypothetical protein